MGNIRTRRGSIRTRERLRGPGFRLHKSLVHYHVAGLTRRFRLTHCDWEMLFAVLAEMQFRRTDRLRFPSTYALLDFLGWETSGGTTYRRVEASIRRWSRVFLLTNRWYRRGTVKAPKGKLSWDGWQRHNRERRKLATGHHFRCRIWSVERQGRAIIIKLDPAFAEQHRDTRGGYFALGYLEQVRRLELPELFLYLRLRAFDGRTVKIGVAKLMGKMGLKVRARSEMIARVRQAVEHITKVTGTNYVMLVKDGDDGPVCYIERPKARKTAVMAETAEVSWSELAERARALSNG